MSALHPAYHYATLPYIGNPLLNFKSGNKALAMAVFFVIAGIASNSLLISKKADIHKAQAFSTPSLVQTAQAQDALSVVAAINGGSAMPEAGVGTDESDDFSPSIIFSGAVQDINSSMSPSFAPISASSPVVSAVAANNTPNFNANFIMPTKGSNLGVLHNDNAVDIDAPCGISVIAAADGIVVPDKNIADVSDGWNGGYGNFILLEHSFGDGISTRYAHLSKVLVNVGDYVKQGQQIGLVGRTGDATGCYLHFEVLGAQNPFAKK